MASTDTRSGFRLPWSSDRTQDDPAFQNAGDDAPESAAAPERPSLAWPETDFATRTGYPAAEQRPPDAPEPAQEAPTMIAAQPPAAPPKKPTKLMADLAAAIRATTEAARDQRLGQLEAEAAGIVEMIRAQSNEGAVALRRRSDEDVAAIRDWAKAEIVRIKEESEGRIAERKHHLEQEVADHAAAIEDRVAEVQSTITGYHRAMAAYFEQLQSEEDPARLATLAETMPDPPALDALTDLADLPIAGAAARHAQAAEVDAQAAPEPDVDDGTETPVAEGDEIIVSEDRIANALGGLDDGAPSDSVGSEPQTEVEGDDAPRWAAGETPDGFPEATEGGDPVDRGAIMAALEAAAEAVVAAEAAAESAETAEAAADVAETAAELLSGRAGQQEDADPEAQAALSARVDAGGFETESYQDRLASLLPGHAEGSTGADGEPRTTQVVVTGLVSVASIASFKRHLGRLGGVTGVAVASGPDGEFIFNVSHRPDVSFRDAIPTMSGFAARVVATGDGVVSVTAHDPEAEG
ncbi:MAG: hypothetical protein ACYDAN_02725 [Candidatus Limnocylindrales bacterium]